MRYIAFGIIGLSTLVQGIQRSKSFARRAVDQPNIQVQNLDNIDSPDTYSGITFNPDTGTYSFDMGSSAAMMNTGSQDPGGIVSNPTQTDYGMANTAFQPPAVSFSDALNSYTPPVYTVTPCSSANNYAADGCIPGSPLYNINMDKPVRAVR